MHLPGVRLVERGSGIHRTGGLEFRNAREPDATKTGMFAKRMTMRELQAASTGGKLGYAHGFARRRPLLAPSRHPESGSGAKFQWTEFVALREQTAAVQGIDLRRCTGDPRPYFGTAGLRATRLSAARGSESYGVPALSVYSQQRNRRRIRPSRPSFAGSYLLRLG